MNPSSLLLAVAIVALYVFLWIGAPILLRGWLRSRRQEAIQRQIALTDAIDARLGPIVSPVVTKPLWGLWRVRIARPLTRPAPVGSMFIEDYAMLLMARERMEETLGSAEQRRAFRSAEAPHRLTRVRLGIALIRLGHWMIRQSSPTPGTPIGLRQAQS